MTATWDIVELGASTTLLQGETIDKGVFVILLKVLALGNKETVKLGYQRGKEKHGTHDREGEEMLKDDEQSQFKKLDMRTRNELCLDDMESPWASEKHGLKAPGRLEESQGKQRLASPEITTKRS